MQETHAEQLEKMYKKWQLNIYAGIVRKKYCTGFRHGFSERSQKMAEDRKTRKKENQKNQKRSEKTAVMKRRKFVDEGSCLYGTFDHVRSLRKIDLEGREPGTVIRLSAYE